MLCFLTSRHVILIYLLFSSLLRVAINSCVLSLGDTGDKVPDPAEEAPDARLEEDEEALKRFSFVVNNELVPKNIFDRNISQFTLTLLKFPSLITK